MQRLTHIWLLLLFTSGCALQSQISNDATDVVTLIAINDVYRIEGVDARRAGGLSRVRSLRAKTPNSLLLHAGDFLAPSLLSRSYQGEQMIDTMNLLDGLPGKFDPYMFVVFGNHEFDLSRHKDMATLQTRISESEFTWLGSNIDFEPTFYSSEVLMRLKKSKLLHHNGINIGIFGLTGNYKQPDYIEGFADPIRVAAEMTLHLRDAGAEYVIALTHLTAREDAEILEQLGADGPDLIIGGHEHERLQHLDPETERLVVKADAEARSASRFTLKRADSELHLEHEYVDLDASVIEDPLVKHTVDEWLDRHESAFCAQMEPDCLSSSLAMAGVTLVGEELEIRRFETNLGNYVTDLALESFADEQADFAIMNSGGLRLNQNIPAGEAITLRDIEELIAFPTNLALIEINGATVKKLFEHAIESWIGTGWFLQVSGISFTHHSDSQAITDIKLRNGMPLIPTATYKMVVNDFLLNSRFDQDGYSMLSTDMIVSGKSVDLKAVLIDRLTKARNISPELDKRICNPIHRPDNCSSRSQQKW